MFENMPTAPAILAYSADFNLLLVAECTGGSETSTESAMRFRHKLLFHELIPNGPFFMLAFSDRLFLWKNRTGLEDPPDFCTTSLPALCENSADRANDRLTYGYFVQSHIKDWLWYLANARRQPRLVSEADQMLVQSGLYERLKRGMVWSNPERR